MKGRALLLVTLILLSSAAVTMSATAEGEETRSTGRVPVRLYIHLTPTDAALSTEQGRTGGTTPRARTSRP